MAQNTPIASTVGTKSSVSGRTVSKVYPTALNDLTHVQVNPNHNRIQVRDATGYEYSTVPSISVQGGTTIILEAN